MSDLVEEIGSTDTSVNTTANGFNPDALSPSDVGLSHPSVYNEHISEADLELGAKIIEDILRGDVQVKSEADHPSAPEHVELSTSTGQAAAYDQVVTIAEKALEENSTQCGCGCGSGGVHDVTQGLDDHTDFVVSDAATADIDASSSNFEAAQTLDQIENIFVENSTTACGCGCGSGGVHDVTQGLDDHTDFVVSDAATADIDASSSNFEAAQTLDQIENIFVENSTTACGCGCGSGGVHDVTHGLDDHTDYVVSDAATADIDASSSNFEAAQTLDQIENIFVENSTTACGCGCGSGGVHDVTQGLDDHTDYVVSDAATADIDASSSNFEAAQTLDQIENIFVENSTQAGGCDYEFGSNYSSTLGSDTQAEFFTHEGVSADTETVVFDNVTATENLHSEVVGSNTEYLTNFDEASASASTSLDSGATETLQASAHIALEAHRSLEPELRQIVNLVSQKLHDGSHLVTQLLGDSLARIQDGSVAPEVLLALVSSAGTEGVNVETVARMLVMQEIAQIVSNSPELKAESVVNALYQPGSSVELVPNLIDRIQVEQIAAQLERTLHEGLVDGRVTEGLEKLLGLLGAEPEGSVQDSPTIAAEGSQSETTVINQDNQEQVSSSEESLNSQTVSEIVEAILESAQGGIEIQDVREQLEVVLQEQSVEVLSDDEIETISQDIAEAIQEGMLPDLIEELIQRAMEAKAAEREVTQNIQEQDADAKIETAAVIAEVVEALISNVDLGQGPEVIQEQIEAVLEAVGVNIPEDTLVQLVEELQKAVDLGSSGQEIEQLVREVLETLGVQTEAVLEIVRQELATSKDLSVTELVESVVEKLESLGLKEEEVSQISEKLEQAIDDASSPEHIEEMICSIVKEILAKEVESSIEQSDTDIDQQVNQNREVIEQLVREITAVALQSVNNTQELVIAIEEIFSERRVELTSTEAIEALVDLIQKAITEGKLEKEIEQIIQEFVDTQGGTNSEVENLISFEVASLKLHERQEVMTRCLREIRIAMLRKDGILSPELLINIEYVVRLLAVDGSLVPMDVNRLLFQLEQLKKKRKKGKKGLAEEEVNGLFEENVAAEVADLLGALIELEILDSSDLDTELLNEGLSEDEEMKTQEADEEEKAETKLMTAGAEKGPSSELDIAQMEEVDVGSYYDEIQNDAEDRVV